MVPCSPSISPGGRSRYETEKPGLIFIAIMGVVLIVLLLSTVREKPRKMPSDDNHRPFSEALAKGGDRATVEKGCVVCHDPKAISLPAGHPPKEQCLICHPPRR